MSRDTAGECMVGDNVMRSMVQWSVEKLYMCKKIYVRTYIRVGELILNTSTAELVKRCKSFQSCRPLLAVRPQLKAHCQLTAVGCCRNASMCVAGAYTVWRICMKYHAGHYSQMYEGIRYNSFKLGCLTLTHFDTNLTQICRSKPRQHFNQYSVTRTRWQRTFLASCTQWRSPHLAAWTSSFMS